MTIADAITYKSNIAFDERLLVTLENQVNRVKNGITQQNQIVEQNAQRLLEVTFGKDNVKVGTGEYEAVYKPFKENNEFSIVDPIAINDKIKMLRDNISAFKVEIDALLSESNANTFIEI
jgi:hypothetical protein